MIKRIFAILIIVIMAGCAAPVRHTVSRDFAQARPQAIVVLPAIWEAASDKDSVAVSRLFRKVSAQRLASFGYAAVPIEEVEAAAERLGDNWFVGKAAHEIAAAFNADTVLYIRIKEWDKDRFLTYASLKITAEFELASAADKDLWRAAYSTKESDLRLDSRSMELALLEAYEPRVERFVNAVFSTLPQGQAPMEPRKSYFNWLP